MWKRVRRHCMFIDHAEIFSFTWMGLDESHFYLFGIPTQPPEVRPSDIFRIWHGILYLFPCTWYGFYVYFIRAWPTTKELLFWTSNDVYPSLQLWNALQSALKQWLIMDSFLLYKYTFSFLLWIWRTKGNFGKRSMSDRTLQFRNKSLWNRTTCQGWPS